MKKFYLLILLLSISFSQDIKFFGTILDTETIEKFISKVSRALEELGQNEISTTTIGTMVMEGLKELDPVAYVRFASVYRNFREEKDFVQFVDKIDVYKKR